MADTAKTATIGAVGLILAAAVAGWFALQSKDGGSDPPAPVTATMQTATSSVIHGQSLHLEGTVQGLGSRTLWVVAYPDHGEGYYPVSEGPVAVGDGPWHFDDPEVGAVDDVGSYITYLAYAANSACAEFLKNTPDDGNGNVFRAVMDDSCKAPVARAKVAVT